MISFRFHVVSITAVFLAIAIGVVVGSTYIDRLTVDQLERRINTVEERAEDAREENDRLEGELGTARDYIGLSAEYAVTDRLLEVPVLVVAVRGIDEDAVERTVQLVRRAGATTPGVVWLETRWAAASEEDLDALASIAPASSSSEPAELWADAWREVFEELAIADAEGTNEGVTPAGDDPGVLAELEAAGFLSVDTLDDASVSVSDLAGIGPRVLFATGTRAQDELAPMVPVAVSASVEAGLGTVVADVHDDAPEGPERGATLLDALGPDVPDLINIVDDADREEGRVAAVLALYEIGGGEVGLHYGYGEGADAVLPSWTAP
jgi:hypothetical protein